MTGTFGERQTLKYSPHAEKAGESVPRTRVIIVKYFRFLMSYGTGQIQVSKKESKHLRNTACLPAASTKSSNSFSLMSRTSFRGALFYYANILTGWIADSSRGFMMRVSVRSRCTFHPCCSNHVGHVLKTFVEILVHSNWIQREDNLQDISHKSRKNIESCDSKKIYQLLKPRIDLFFSVFCTGCSFILRH